MSRMPHELQVDAQLTQVAWVRRLALAVARDASEADDLAQEAWLAALSRKPDANQPLGGWFRRVLLNLARLRRRGDARRGARERSAARPERDDEGGARHAGDPLVALERLETQEALLRAVRELDEPFRTTVVLHWFEGLAPAQIAVRVNAPLRTVQARLARGLALLRERLDRDARRDAGGDGDRSRWLSAWLPLLTRTDTPWPWILIMDAKLKLALASVAAIGALSAVWMALPERAEHLSAPLVRDVEAHVELEKSAAPAAPLANEMREQIAAALATTPAAPAPVVARETKEIEGVVIDTNGVPVAAVALDYAAHLRSGAQARAMSDARGAFVLPPPEADGDVRVSSERWTTVLAAHVDLDRIDGGNTLVVAPRIALEGVVVDEQMNPVAGAKVALEAGDVRARLHAVLDHSTLETWSTTSDAAGRFRLGEVPALASAKLRARALGFMDEVADAGLQPRFDVKLVLHPRADTRLHGTVVDAAGSPVEGAYVALSETSTRSDASGRFELVLNVDADLAGGGRAEPSPADRTLRAVKAGFLPVELASVAEDVHDPRAWPDPLVLRMAGPSLSIRGHVVNASGKPAASIAIRLLDRSAFAYVDVQIGATRVNLRSDLETLLAGDQYPVDVRTGADGSFEVRGLLARSYRLRVIDRRTLRALISEPIEAGASDVELRLPGDELIPRLAGRVVDRRGNGVAGARVSAELGKLTAKLEDVGEMSSEATTTDAEGRFELRELSRAAEQLVVQLESSLNRRTVALAEVDDLERIEVRVAGTCHLQVEAANPGSLAARSFRVLDAQGEAMQMAVHQGDISYAMTTLYLQEGRSQAVQVSDAAATLVLLRDDVEVKRMPLDLRTGELNVVRP